MSELVVLAAGGTGGHVFPAQALAAELKARGRAFALMTDRRGAGFGDLLDADAIYTVRAGRVTGRSVPGRLRGLADVAVGVLQARRLLRRLRPAGVVGFGGYASVPAVYAAAQLGLPTLIHEQNAVFGRANRLLAPRVRAIATSFADTAQLAPADRAKAERTGNPVRAAVAAIGAAPYPEADGVLSLLVTGGSQGATVMADVVPRALAALAEPLRRRLRVAHQCRAEDLGRVRDVYREAGIPADFAPFFTDLPERLAAAQLVIGRAGASTVAELTAAGRPAILVPYPAAADDHQTANAAAVARAGGGWLIPEGAFTPEALARRIETFLGEPSLLAQAAAKARAAGAPEAATRLADLVDRRIPARGSGANGARYGASAREVAA